MTIQQGMAKVHDRVHSTPQMKALQEKIQRLMAANGIEGEAVVTVTLKNIRYKAEPIAAKP